MTSEPDLLAIRASVDRMGRLSDNIFRIGPLSVGLDGILSWIPAVGELYSAGAAVFLIGQGLRARVDIGTLVVCGALMASRTAITAVPLLGPLASDVLTMHKWSARLIVAAIDRKLAGRDLRNLRSAGVSPAMGAAFPSRA
jgi:hypothetical protein